MPRIMFGSWKHWQVHAWCLMPNHFHLVVETPQPNLVDGMKWLLGTYTSHLQMGNRSYLPWLFQQYKSKKEKGKYDNIID